jgi:hypothetical protein
VIELLKHEYVIMPFETLRQLEQTLGDGSTTLPESLPSAEEDGDEEGAEAEGGDEAEAVAEEWEQDEPSENDDEEEEV